MITAVPSRGGQLEREEKILSDTLRRKPADSGEGRGAHRKIGAATDSRSPRVEARLAAEEECRVLVVEDVSGAVQRESQFVGLQDH